MFNLITAVRTSLDGFLNSYTMYRIVLYGLSAIVLFALLLSAVGVLSFSVLQLLVSLGLLLATAQLSNIALSRVLNVVTNVESALITGLILFLIVHPFSTVTEALYGALIAAIAMASKYLFAIKKRHLFNPAAIATVIVGYFLLQGPTWWVTSLELFPMVLVVGLLIVRKIRRFSLFFAFAGTAFATILGFGLLQGAQLANLSLEILISWPLIFFGTVMLTEPLTTPPTKQLQIFYGILVGFLFGLPLKIGSVYMTPELALVLGNIFSYAVSPKAKLVLTLVSKKAVAHQLYHFVFKMNQPLAFAAGQYLEWTLPCPTFDSRGNRRYFTIASSPTENELHLGVKIPEQASSFKKALSELKVGETMLASHLAGDFTLPEDRTRKMVFIAGGIGITPFRSMVKYLVDKKARADITLIYAASRPDEFAYQELWQQARAIGVKTTYLVTKPANTPTTWKGPTGRLNQELLSQLVPDYQDRLFYLSGPQAMVDGYHQLLLQAGVTEKQLKLDFFPGF